MKPYLLSLLVGLLVGIAYHLSGVRSPAPPVIALVGLLGILIGEQAIPVAKKFLVPIEAKGHSAVTNLDSTEKEK